MCQTYSEIINKLRSLESMYIMTKNVKKCVEISESACPTLPGTVFSQARACCCWSLRAFRFPTERSLSLRAFSSPHS